MGTCRRLVGALHALGLHEGDRVAIVGRTATATSSCTRRCRARAMVLVPLNQRHTDAELRYTLEDSGTKVLFADRAVEGLPACVEHVVDLDDGYESCSPAPTPADFPDELPRRRSPGLFYTGGTTGASKGVMLTHRNLIANALHYQAFCPFRPGDVLADRGAAVPRRGVHRRARDGVERGRQVVLPAFDAAVALDLIERHGVTGTLVVPTMLAALSEEQLARPRDVVEAPAICHGGRRSPPRRCAAPTGLPDAELLGDVRRDRDGADRDDVPRRGATARLAAGPFVRSARGRRRHPHPRHRRHAAPTRRGGRGRGPRRQRDGRLLEQARADGGRAGRRLVPHAATSATMDDEGYVYLVDRAKDMIVTGGENVYSTEVEDVLYRHPAVLEAAVFGVPDAHWGEAVHAVVVPRAEVTEGELIEHCRAAIAGYKVPKQIELRAEPLPKSGAGKVLKRELREPYWAGRESRVGGS